jgi:hypothetical protein
MPHSDRPDYKVIYRYKCSCGYLNRGTLPVNAGTIDGASRIAVASKYTCSECGSCSKREKVIVTVQLLSF